MSEAVISIQNLSKTFGTNEVLKDISFEVKRGEVVTIIGSSGSGKSTLLRCVNLLEKPTSGEIYYNGQNILEHDKSIYEYRTHVGMVFQRIRKLYCWTNESVEKIKRGSRKNRKRIP